MSPQQNRFSPSLSADVECLCIGNELLEGKNNTHLSLISKELQDISLTLRRQTTLPDDIKAIAQEIRQSLNRCDILLICGGLGPTFDDITREAVSQALGRPLIFHPRLYADIRQKFKRFRIRLPQENRRQAYLIQGARCLPNRHGSAPGQALLLARRGQKPQSIFLLPGPYLEMSSMLKTHILPRLKRTYARDLHTASTCVHLTGLPESAADEKLRSVTAMADENLKFTILASAGQVDFHARALAKTRARARRRLRGVQALIMRKVAPYVFARDGQTLETTVAKLLKHRRLTISTAESCTAGLVAARLTSVPGSSDYFLGGIMAYHPKIKESFLGVSRETLLTQGAVSSACAREMAQGVRGLTHASLGLSVTGLAGPGGGSRENPVGTVYLAIDGPGRRKSSKKLTLLGNRETIRARAALAALQLLWEHIKP